METDEVVALEAKYIVPTYIRPPVVFSHGQGNYLYDMEGNRYLDFSAGIAVTALGHSDEMWAKAVADQASRLTHVSNLYHTLPQLELAQRLVQNSFADKVFFCNSGSEANETALKFARKYARSRSDAGSKTGIVAFHGSFHGRTMGALSTTYKGKYRQPFEPLIPGVTFAEFNDPEAAAGVINTDTCAVIVEPVQGEGGIHPANPAFLAGLRKLCDENGALLIFDEVQCGLGRTGTLWAHEKYGVTPDIMTLAKPLAGGLPIGATLVTEAVSAVMKPGDHGNTFAGGPLVCSAANVVFDRINDADFLAHVRDTGDYLLESLSELDSSQVVAIRGKGLLIGLELSIPVAPLIRMAREHGLLVINAGDNVLRLCPPLIVSRADVDQAVNILGRCLKVIP
jgi:predicted acetylornithine/succinylornithine family transaminase